nr:SRPBCC domain-containing protein [Ktedonobacteraceae bacterium]
MDITGSQKIKAPRPQVFAALLNPDVLKESIPGCESAKLVDMAGGQQLKLRISPNIPGFKGSHVVFLQTGEVVAPSRVVLIAEPTSSMGSIKAICTVDLAEDAGAATILSYNAHAEMEGKISNTPEIILKGAVKVALDQFFKHFEKQVVAITA